MDTFQISETVLDNYRNDELSEERITALKEQANEQIKEISQNEVSLHPPPNVTELVNKKY